MDSLKAYWERLYAERDPDTFSWYQPEPTLSLQLIERCAIGPDTPILDVGGGTSALVDRLLERGYRQIAVLDISANALELARRRLGDRAAVVDWLELDIADYEPSQPLGLWHDRAVFHFMTESADRTRYIQTLHRSLAKGGHLIISAFGMSGPTRCSGLDTLRYDAATLCAELGRDFKLVEATGEMHVTPAREQQAFAYFRFVRVR